MLTPQLAERIDDVEYRGEKVISVMVNLGSKHLNLIQSYAPWQGRPTAKKEEFYNILQEVYETVRYKEKGIVLGAMSGHDDRESVMIESIIGELRVEDD